jgi:hypothetical protein
MPCVNPAQLHGGKRQTKNDRHLRPMNTIRYETQAETRRAPPAGWPDNRIQRRKMETVTQYTWLAMLISGPRYPHILETMKRKENP